MLLFSADVPDTAPARCWHLLNSRKLKRVYVSNMANPRNRKASRRGIAEQEIRQGKSHDEVFAWLFNRFCNAHISAKERQELALAILPYTHRKLAPQPIPEQVKAIAEGRLVVVTAPID